MVGIHISGGEKRDFDECVSLCARVYKIRTTCRRRTSRRHSIVARGVGQRRGRRVRRGGSGAGLAAHESQELYEVLEHRDLRAREGSRRVEVRVLVR